jgi:hypothetical protein
MATLTTSQVAQVKEALACARSGCATLPQLAAAHEAASSAGLTSVVGELREHVRRLVPGPVMRTEAKALGLGILSGVLTHYLLRSVDRKVES